MMNGKSLFDVMDTLPFEDFVELLAVKLAEKSSVSTRCGEKRKVIVDQPKDYYTTNEVAKMFGCDKRRVSEPCRYGRFPSYVKIENKGPGVLGGYHFEKNGIDRLYKESPDYFVPVNCRKNTLLNTEARS